ncbi:Predicted Fe2+/Mn2+ transporter, VIT1/CCC1 family [Frankineae bacterium MT45]|nr:Predicted Fe2+/Mn2+ transporter, VIT1/CCC1 family [Frankineae bacterium MT45]
MSRAEIHHQHRDVSGGWLRPTVFGMMDGLVSNFALLAGVTAADTARSGIVLAGLAGLVGGAFSMATGEYVSVQSQNESVRAEIDVERHELKVNAAAELEELAQMYVARGVEPALAREVAQQLSHDPEQALEIHALEELGVQPGALPSPWTAAGSSLSAFALGALIPLLPFLFGATSVLICALLSCVALFVAGAISSRFTSRTWVFAGGRQLLLGGVAAAVTFGVGSVFGAVVG